MGVLCFFPAGVDVGLCRHIVLPVLLANIAARLLDRKI